MRLLEFITKMATCKATDKIARNGYILICKRSTVFCTDQPGSLSLPSNTIKSNRSSMGKRVRLTNELVNDYGTRILTSGMDISQYLRNPVLLYMHVRGNVIGLVKNIRVDGDEITGELEFDEASDLSVRAKKQFEFGSLRMVSVRVDVIELSSDPALMVAGQTEPTVTKSKLIEVSVVDIGSNDDALVLYHEGRELTLGSCSENPFFKLYKNSKKHMELKELALKLGLPADADDAAVEAKINELNAAKASQEAAVKECETLRLSSITAAVDAAIKDRRLAADRKDQFVELGRKIGLEDLDKTLKAMSPAAKVIDAIRPGGTVYAKLGDVPESELLTMRENDPDTYRRLYKAEYGVDCEL